MTGPLITSRQNSRVKLAVALRAGRERRKRGLFLIDGEREIARALASGVKVVEVFVEEGARREALGARGNGELVERLRLAGAEILMVTAEVYEKLCFGERDDVGVVVVAETPRRGLADLQLGPAPLIAAIEGVEKPGNVGAILRSADAAGVDAVIVADGGTDLFNPNTIRASLGTVFRPNVVEATSREAIDWLRAKGIKAPGLSAPTAMRIVVARPDAELEYTAVDFRGGVAIVLGSEAAGLSDAWQGENVVPVRLPMRGIADSLNVSTTAAVLFYEARRQRG